MSGSIQFRVRNRTGNEQSIASASTFNGGEFHHVVAVRNMEEELLQLFIDGQLESAAVLAVPGDMSPGADNDNDPITIGAARQPNPNPMTNFLAGDIDELSYYLGALSLAEVANLASNGKCTIVL